MSPSRKQGGRHRWRWPRAASILIAVVRFVVARVTVRRVIAFVRLGRPLFLTGGFVLYALGAAIAAHQGAVIDWTRYVWGQLAITATQLMTHYCNDYFDFAADRANATPTRWSGG